MDGDSLPVSAFKGREDGTYPQGAAAYEKRGVAVFAPIWNPKTCIQCNQCAFVCPHAAIRPFAMNADEAAKAPANTLFAEKPVIKTDYKFTMAVSPLDCMGCTLCVKACPVTAKATKDGKPENAALPAGCVQLRGRERFREARAARHHRQGKPVQAAAA